jgi:hypothetical protein
MVYAPLSLPPLGTYMTIVWNVSWLILNNIIYIGRKNQKGNVSCADGVPAVALEHVYCVPELPIADQLVLRICSTYVSAQRHRPRFCCKNLQQYTCSQPKCAWNTYIAEHQLPTVAHSARLQQLLQVNKGSCV